MIMKYIASGLTNAPPLPENTYTAKQASNVYLLLRTPRRFLSRVSWNVIFSVLMLVWPGRPWGDQRRGVSQPVLPAQFALELAFRPRTHPTPAPLGWPITHSHPSLQYSFIPSFYMHTPHNQPTNRRLIILKKRILVGPRLKHVWDFFLMIQCAQLVL